ncbi:hypothetical protein CC80DRAFT_81634 [Byssothecium circinans]|uniref:Uncharacterized protein n=1 Tax=Byssothecium circinans TaxID=147558 RepID=A0A6A5TTB0_9PLEO|nr:hypothetical protein CC80DRAFT_81634 [Byssothecium circinans]
MLRWFPMLILMASGEREYIVTATGSGLESINSIQSSIAVAAASRQAQAMKPLLKPQHAARLLAAIDDWLGVLKHTQSWPQPALAVWQSGTCSPSRYILESHRSSIHYIIPRTFYRAIQYTRSCDSIVIDFSHTTTPPRHSSRSIPALPYLL